MIHGKNPTPDVWLTLVILVIFGVLCVYGTGVNMGWIQEWESMPIQQEQPQQEINQ